jgi:uncharacterized protein
MEEKKRIKLLVTGSFNAGKTSFIHSVSDRAVSVDRFGTTIALDHGHCIHNGETIELFGTPGQERFDPVLSFLGPSSLGLVVMVSAVDPAGFSRAKEMVEKAGLINAPVVIVANKANLRGAVPDTAIRNAMRLDNTIPIIRTQAADLEKVQPGLPCTLNKEDVTTVLNTILEKIHQQKKESPAK